MTDKNQLTPDELIDAAYEIFLDLACDNLDPADMILLAAQFEEQGAADLVAVGFDWDEHVGFEVDEDNYAEVVVGLVDEDDALTDIYARLLISKDQDEKFCHILWKQTEQE
ncbi:MULTISPECIES: HI1450 family dsDNA-mimic protein [unclassified Motilimonas]|uniref:HI1450 family dsDNA-mimic protein n=1 Tax=Motilimonas TaxID=1914248 RepID=UPI001E3CC7A2|nr:MULTISPECIES: HI1450 family dsDNA-mimic protein [unclassified Motilimonas]MCE0557111.1 HI1450 family dsDNA-mimic protein [Motilimonas sp. E26]MDO6524346.1 HI1450 family dsDNA-mimic protein [Motilimonas sp. 1_MG-2023]